MTLRVCAESGCPELTKGTRCQAHTRARDKARGTRQQRGYDNQYDSQRKHYAKRMTRGERFLCWTCHKPLDPSSPWDLGHCRHERLLIHGPQHVACNRDTSLTDCEHTSHMR